jgi:hypothetical protein
MKKKNNICFAEQMVQQIQTIRCLGAFCSNHSRNVAFATENQISKMQKATCNNDL